MSAVRQRTRILGSVQLLSLATPVVPNPALTTTAFVPTAPIIGHEWKVDFLEILAIGAGAVNIIVLGTIVVQINDMTVYQRQISFAQNNPFYVVDPFRDIDDLGGMIIYNNDPVALALTLQPTAGANRLFCNTVQLNIWGTFE